MVRKKIKIKSVKLSLDAMDWGLKGYNDATAAMLNDEVAKCIAWGFSAIETKRYMDLILDSVSLSGMNRAPRSVLVDVLLAIYGDDDTYDALANVHSHVSG